MQKYGWGFLKPLIEETVSNIFTHQFESQAKQSFSHWIRLASAREVVRPLVRISNLLPNILEAQVYSEEVMFGATPFRQALDRAAIRFVDEAYTNHRKILLVISDGEFREEAEVMVSANLLKKRNVVIISCLIHNRNILEQFIKKSPKNWPTGAKRMLDIASEIPKQILSNSDNKIVTRTLTESKLCYQINHSNILDQIIESIFEGFTGFERDIS